MKCLDKEVDFLKDENLSMDLLLGAPLPELDKVIKIAKNAEKYNFDGFWLPDHLLMVPQGFMPDVWTVLSGIAVETENIELGTGVTCPHRRHPAVLAQTCATLDKLSKGRFNLGIGAGEAMNLDPFGIDWDKPVTRMVEFIQIAKKLWNEDKVDYDGEFFQLEDAFLQVEPEENVPVYLGANGPKTRRIAGKLGEGWMPIAESPTTYKNHLEDVEKGIRKNDRNPSEVDKALQVYTGIVEDEEKLSEVKMYPAMMLAMNSQKLEKAGYELDLPEGITQDYYFKQLLPGEETSTELIELVQQVPDEAIKQFSIIGTKNQCIEKIEKFIKAGVEKFCFINIGPDPKKVMKILGTEIIPHFKQN